MYDDKYLCKQWNLIVINATLLIEIKENFQISHISRFIIKWQKGEIKFI